LFHFPKSGVLCWPLKEVEDAINHYCFEFVKECSKPCILPIFTLDGILACSLVVRSWYWQHQSCPFLRAGRPAIRLFATDVPAPLQMVAAMNAFWSLSRTDLGDFAKLWHIPLEVGSSLVDVLFTMVLHITKKSEVEVMDILHKRLVYAEVKNQWSAELLEIDAAIQCLEKQDQEVVEAEKVKSSVATATTKDFLREYKNKRAAVELKVKAAKGKKKLFKALVMPFEMTHAEAKAFLPPGTSIWRGLSRCTWYGHCKPHRRVQAKWVDYDGEQAACKAMIKILWTQYLDMKGYPYSECAVQDLF
jgi:hypothetical protein